VTTVRHAALVHDLGRTGVPNSIWDKAGPLSDDELEGVRPHAYYTGRVLHRAGRLACLSSIASAGQVKSFDRPDERPELPGGHARLVHLEHFTLVQGELEAGWRWSNDWRPIMGTPSCQIPHLGVVLSGRMR
jgi:hypothetical protein